MTQWFARPRRANGYAVVASILLVGGVIVLSMRWASIDTPSLDALEMEELTDQLAQRHDGALLDVAFNTWSYATEEQAAYELSRSLQIDRLIVFNLSGVGLTFAGAESVRDLPVPVVGQLLYANLDGSENPVSLFLVPNRGEVAVRPTLPSVDGREIWMRWERAGDGENPARGLVGSDESLIYVLISRDVGALQAAAGRIGGIVTGQ